MRIDAITRASLGWALPDYLVVRGKPKAPTVDGKAWFVHVTPLKHRKCTVTDKDGAVKVLPISRPKETEDQRRERVKREAAVYDERIAELGTLAERLRAGDNAKRAAFKARHGRDLIETPRAIAPLPSGDTGRRTGQRCWNEIRPEFRSQWVEIRENRKPAPMSVVSAPTVSAVPAAIPAVTVAPVKVERKGPPPISELTAAQRKELLDSKVRLSAHERKRAIRLQRSSRLEQERQERETEAAKELAARYGRSV